jgi:hypothetical protein
LTSKIITKRISINELVRALFASFIKLSARAHVSPQEKSKYVTVLSYARASKVKPTEFQKFLRKQGEIKGCIRASKE